MFNPSPRIQSLPIADGYYCHVIDDVLLEPDRLVEFAVAQRDRFEAAPFNAYPGLELRMPADFSTHLDDFFRRHLRSLFGARRTLRMYSRLAMVTLQPSALQPRQWICHRDRLAPGTDHCCPASVLYLFRDESLGGTSFYTPSKPQDEIERLIQDSGELPAQTFADKYALQRGYLSGSNAYFEHVLRVPARWNRMVFYDGGALFHSGDIPAPERLSDDPRHGRLSLNGFFTCSRKAT